MPWLPRMVKMNTPLHEIPNVSLKEQAESNSVSRFPPHQLYLLIDMGSNTTKCYLAGIGQKIELLGEVINKIAIANFEKEITPETVRHVQSFIHRECFAYGSELKLPFKNIFITATEGYRASQNKEVFQNVFTYQNQPVSILELSHESELKLEAFATLKENTELKGNLNIFGLGGGSMQGASIHSESFTSLFELDPEQTYLFPDYGIRPFEDLLNSEEEYQKILTIINQSFSAQTYPQEFSKMKRQLQFKGKVLIVRGSPFNEIFMALGDPKAMNRKLRPLYQSDVEQLYQKISQSKNLKDLIDKLPAHFKENYQLSKLICSVLTLRTLILVFPFSKEASLLINTDPELGYPLLIQSLLGPGLLGLVVVSLLAAFMSTVDTHLNWGASYLVNDVYKKYIRPEAKNTELLLASRASIVLITVLALIISTHIQSIAEAWRWVLALGAGLGFATLARWFWWRINAWSEIASMIAAVLGMMVIPLLAPSIGSDYLMFWNGMIGFIVCVGVTWFTTEKRKNKQVWKFVTQIDPVGFWGNYYSGVESRQKQRLFWDQIKYWGIGCLGIYSILFGVGYLIFNSMLIGSFSLFLGIFCFYFLLKWIEAK